MSSQSLLTWAPFQHAITSCVCVCVIIIVVPASSNSNISSSSSNSSNNYSTHTRTHTHNNKAAVTVPSNHMRPLPSPPLHVFLLRLLKNVNCKFFALRFCCCCCWRFYKAKFMQPSGLIQISYVLVRVLIPAAEMTTTTTVLSTGISLSSSPTAAQPAKMIGIRQTRLQSVLSQSDDSNS